MTFTNIYGIHLKDKRTKHKKKFNCNKKVGRHNITPSFERKKKETKLQGSQQRNTK